MSRLLCLGLLGLLAVAAVSAKPHEEFTKEHVAEVAQECKTETGATDEDVEHMMKSEPTESHEGKCLRACMMKKFEILNDAGKMNTEPAIEMTKFLNKIDADKDAAVTELINHCAAIEVPEDHCDAADTYIKCMVEQMQEHGISLN